MNQRTGVRVTWVEELRLRPREYSRSWSSSTQDTSYQVVRVGFTVRYSSQPFFRVPESTVAGTFPKTLHLWPRPPYASTMATFAAPPRLPRANERSDLMRSVYKAEGDLTSRRRLFYDLE